MLFVILFVFTLAGCSPAEMAFFLTPPGSQAEADALDTLAAEYLQRDFAQVLASVPQHFRQPGSTLTWDGSLKAAVYVRPDGQWLYRSPSGWVMGE